MMGRGMYGPGGMEPGGMGMYELRMEPGMGMYGQDRGPGADYRVEPGGPGIGPRGPIGPARPVTPKISAGELETLDEVKIWAHDVTADPGKTYRYRLRVILYNPLAGYKPLLKNRDQALLVGITGPWSQPSKPVTMEKATYFFVTGPGDSENSAEVAVYHWNSGWLCRGKFQVAPGQPIGGKQVKTFYQRGKDGKSLIERKEPVDFSTGATMVDVVGQQEIAVRKKRGRADQFDYETQLATAITYLDKQGQMHQQDSANAKDNQGYKSCKKALKDQRKLRRELEIVREGE